MCINTHSTNEQRNNIAMVESDCADAYSISPGIYSNQSGPWILL